MRHSRLRSLLGLVRECVLLSTAVFRFAYWVLLFVDLAINYIAGEPIEELCVEVRV